MRRLLYDVRMEVHNTMNGAVNNAIDIYRAVFDAIPALVFIVNSDFRITQHNAAVANLFNGGAILQHRTGEIMKCLHATDARDGCGSGPFCKNCILRTAISQAFQGSQVVRRRTTIEVLSDGNTSKICALISANPFRHHDESLALFMIEDIGETNQLRPFITICSGCRKVRNDHGAWLPMEAYFKDMAFSHGYCPDCLDVAATNIKKQFMAAMDDGEADTKRVGIEKKKTEAHQKQSGMDSDDKALLGATEPTAP
jgi:hypothetical protein